MSKDKDPKKDESKEDSTKESDGCDCSCCPGCGAPDKPETKDEE